MHEIQEAVPTDKLSTFQCQMDTNMIRKDENWGKIGQIIQNRGNIFLLFSKPIYEKLQIKRIRQGFKKKKNRQEHDEYSR